ncbi:MAG TPA: NAD(P)/FAD-dependent oxidoreductase [Candidatus Sulfotelmatobacter sp.]|nr:NAD(P)/FAD-dependent oxidoreductase [Candidatus Sulfotelmatobacter sp.]
MSAGSVAVVGAGAAGLTAAIRAAESGAHVTLLNAHPKVGLKILMSGGTRCNVTHREVTAADYFGGSRNVVARILRAFTPDQTREWFESLGVALKLEDTGKYFPVTDDAQTVLDALLRECSRLGVELRAGARVVHIDVEGERSETERRVGEAPPNAVGRRFRLGIQHVKDAAVFSSKSTPVPDEFLDADAVILATGGLSFPRTGSDGVGYQLARWLGHSIVPTVPALTPLTSEEPWCMMLKGLSVDAELTLRVNDKVEAKTRGSLLLTHFGYSGPAALDLSRHWLRAEGRGVVTVSLSVAPGETRESLEKQWLGASKDPRLAVRRHLGVWLPDRLVVTLCAEAGVGPSLKLTQVPRERRRELIELLVSRPLRISGTLGFEKAEVTAGGVPLEEVNASTLESRRCAGLFLCGEILDVEGRLGGFNFQWAWSSGMVAGRAASM